MINKVAFTMYPVENLQRARDFYENTLKLPLGNVFGENGNWVEYDLPGGGCFAITDMVEGLKPSSDAGGSIAFEVDDLDALVSRLKDENVNFKMDIFPTPVCRIAVIYDSEGNAVTLHQLKK